MTRRSTPRSPGPPPRQQTPGTAHARFRRALAHALVALAAVLPYLPTTHFGYINWDDNINIIDNPFYEIADTDSLWELWKQPLHSLYIPVFYTSYWIEANLWGLDHPGISHFINTLLHAANGLLVLSLLTRLLGRGPAPVLGALLFVLHPLQTEPVCWITGRKDLLLGFFSLLSLRFYLDFATHARARDYALASLCLLLALMSKPSAVSVPLIAAALAALCLRTPLRRLAFSLAPWLLICAAWVLLTQKVQPVRAEHVAPLSPLHRLLVATDTLTFYADKVVRPFGLAAIYGRTPAVALGSRWAYATLLSALVLAVIFWRGGRETRAAILAILAALLPVLGLVPFAYQRISTVADRYMYLALFGVALLLAQALRALTRPDRPRPLNPVVYAASVVALLVLAVLTVRQVHVWRSSRTLWANVLAVDPDSWTAWHNLGTIAVRAGDVSEAHHCFSRCVELEPDHAAGIAKLAPAELMRGRLTDADRLFRRALDLEPDAVDALANQARVRAALGDDAEARSLLERARNLDPDNVELMLKLARILATAPDDHLRDGPEALRLARLAAEKTAYRDPRVFDVIALAAAESGNFPLARDWMQKALDAAHNLGRTDWLPEFERHATAIAAGRPFRHTDRPAPPPR